jgi:MFS transporter, ACS family, tartrate transporter
LFGLDGWRFMILFTGIPAVFLGIMCFYYLTDRPSQAKWLTDEERDLLVRDLSEEEKTYATHTWRAVLASGKVWILGLGYFGLVFGLYAIGFFLPTIIKGFQATFDVTYSVFQIGLLTSIPYAFAVLFLIVWSRHSRLHNEVTKHIVVCALMGSVGILAAVWAPSPFVILIGVTIAAMGICTGIPLWFGMPTKFLTGVGAATGLALINTIGNFGGFSGPFMFGWLRDLTGSTDTGIYLIAGFCLVSVVVAISFNHWKIAKPRMGIEGQASNTDGARSVAREF